jgi:hypothetical protein
LRVFGDGHGTPSADDELPQFHQPIVALSSSVVPSTQKLPFCSPAAPTLLVEITSQETGQKEAGQNVEDEYCRPMPAFP